MAHDPPRQIRPRIRTLLGVALATGWLAACASAASFREENRQHLEELRVGMERSEVLELMGVGERKQLVGSERQGPIGTDRDSMGVVAVQIPIGADSPILYNPHRSELYEGDGSSWEVLYYYTHIARDDGRITEDELTPLVLRDGILTGWGWTHWAAQNGRHDLGAELPSPLPDPDHGVP